MFYDLMGVEKEAMGIYVDSWGIKRMISFLIRRWKCKSTSVKPKDGFVLGALALWRRRSVGCPAATSWTYE